MRARRSWRRTVLGLLAAVSAGAWAVSGCSDTDRVHLDVALQEREAEHGQLALGLTARGASGALYRLREAVFQANQIDGLGFSSALLFSESDPTATRLETTLNTGGYQIDLFGGWFLEKVEAGSATRVQATLLSPSQQFFDIRTNEETFVTYRFETNGEVIEFGDGRLVIQIEVEENAIQPPPDAGFPPVLGEPLVLVDGLVTAESNAHGIRAGFFVTTAPVGSNIEITSSTGSFCVRGELGQVTNNDFANQWGALAGFSFLRESDSGVGERAPWDRDGGRVTGFAFDVTGPAVPPLRFGASNAGVPPDVVSCHPLAPGEGTFVVPFTELDFNCWEGLDNPFVAGDLSEVLWTLPADSGSSHPFDFCLSNVRPILQQ